MSIPDSNRPFPDALRALMYEAEVSFRTLARESGYSLAYIQALAVGRKGPTPECMERIAQACDQSPRFFLAYREHLAAQRAAALVATVGLERILGVLDELAAQETESSHRPRYLTPCE